MLNMKRLGFILCCLFLITANIAAQNGAQISADELTYNFGTIAEADGLARRSAGHHSYHCFLWLHATGMDKRTHRPGKDRKRKSDL